MNTHQNGMAASSWGGMSFSGPVQILHIFYMIHKIFVSCFVLFCHDLPTKVKFRLTPEAIFHHFL